MIQSFLSEQSAIQLLSAAPRIHRRAARRKRYPIGTNNAQRSKLADIIYIGHDDHGNVQMTGVTAYKTAPVHDQQRDAVLGQKQRVWRYQRSEEHTSELQSPCNLVCRLLHEKKK